MPDLDAIKRELKQGGHVESEDTVLALIAEVERLRGVEAAHERAHSCLDTAGAPEPDALDAGDRILLLAARADRLQGLLDEAVSEATKAREHIERISNDVRNNGDVQLAHLSEEGVTAPLYLTLADELWLSVQALGAWLKKVEENR